MDYRTFQRKIRGLSRQVGIEATTYKGANGRMYGNFADGTAIIGLEGNYRVTVRWGATGSHQALAYL